MSKVTIKLVKGHSYASPLFKERVVQRGETVQVAEDKAEMFLKDGYYDPSNNFHRYFALAAKASAEEVEEEEVKNEEGQDTGEGDISGEEGDDKKPAKRSRSK